MNSLARRLLEVDWQQATDELLINGFTQVSKLLTPTLCNELKTQYQNQSLFRKTVDMQRYRFGKGEYQYFNYPLPRTIEWLRQQIYAKLVPVANAWMKQLNINVNYPKQHRDFLNECKAESQTLATPLLLKYQQGGYNTLHQDLYGSVYFPIQLVINLSQPGVDYHGGELVLTQQIPRAQSKATVLQPQQGDMVIFSTNFRPQSGSRGYYRVTMKHGVSEITQGERYALGVIFHDAKQ